MNLQTEIWVPHPHPSGRGSMPRWVTEMLEQERAPIARRGIFRHCTKCKQIIVVGLDADVAAWKVEVDPTPLNAKQELACHLVGRRTWSLTVRNRSLEIDVREPANARPPEHEPFHVVPRHQCGARFPGFCIPATAPDAGRRPPF